MSVVMQSVDTPEKLFERSSVSSTTSQDDKDSRCEDADICDTCSGEGCSEELDDGEVSLCSWATDQGDWEPSVGMAGSPPAAASEVGSEEDGGDHNRTDSTSSNCPAPSTNGEEEDSATLSMNCADGCVTWVPVWIPMPPVWQMENPPPLLGAAAAPGEWHVTGEEQQQWRWSKPFPQHDWPNSRKQERLRKQGRQQRLQSQLGDVDSPDNVPNDDLTRTTLILRNCPIECGRDALVKTLDAEGFAGLYDFVHLPVEFQSDTVLGYAIVNLVNHKVAERALQHFHGFCGWHVADSKPCEVAWNTPLQGLAAHIDRYRNSPLMHASVPEIYRPLLFQNRVRVNFPKPNAKVRAPRIRNRW